LFAIVVFIVYLLLPAGLLLRDWKYADKGTRNYQRFTKGLLGLWVIFGLLYAFLYWEQNSENKDLQVKVNELVKNSNTQSKLINSLNEIITTKFEAAAIRDLDEAAKIVEERYNRIIEALPQETNKWTQDLKNQLERKRHQVDELIEERRQVFQRSIPFLNGFFGYVLVQFDEIVNAYQKNGIDLKLTGQGDYDLFDSKNYKLRDVILPNKNVIYVALHAGTLKNGEVKHYPTLSFFGHLPSYRFRFTIEAQTGEGKIILSTPDIVTSIAYPIDQDPLLDEARKRAVRERLNDLFECVYLSPPSTVANKMYK